MPRKFFEKCFLESCCVSVENFLVRTDQKSQTSFQMADWLKIELTFFMVRQHFSESGGTFPHKWLNLAGHAGTFPHKWLDLTGYAGTFPHMLLADSPESGWLAG